MKPWTKPSFGDDETITTAWKDESSGLIIVNTWQDIEAIIEDNKRLQSEPQKSDFCRHTMRVPLNVCNQLLQREWDRGNRDLKFGSPEFDELLRRFVSDPDNRNFRVDK